MLCKYFILFYSFLKDLLDLLTGVRLEADGLLSHARRYFSSQRFWKIKSVRNGYDDKFALLLLRPLENAIKHFEVSCLEEIYLVDDKHPKSSNFYLHWFSNSLNPCNFSPFSK